MAPADRERLKEILKKQSILRGEFTLSSGKKSNYYIDARLTTLYHEGVYLVPPVVLEGLPAVFSGLLVELGVDVDVEWYGVNSERKVLKKRCKW